MLRNNRVKNLLGIEYPILQGGMAWVADAELASAVSNGGGLGVIAAGSMPPELLEREIVKAKSMTDKPFGVNIMLLSPTAEDAIEVVAGQRVPVVTTGAGSPGKVIERLKPLGTKIFPVIASSAHAKRVARQGADAVIAEGMEAGGHIGETTTMVLVPQIADTVEIPVIAAGGIADARAVVAAFALGAEGVQVGTRFACCLESKVHEAYKREIIKARDRGTVVTGRATGHPVRCLQNKFTKKFEELEKRGTDVKDLEEFGTGKLRAAVIEGDVEWGSVMAGQSAALVQAVEPAQTIIREMFGQATEILQSLEKNLFE
ncbi:MAG: enoyl-[acyl-carrier-protein] reductase FabK [Thermovirgaceae bacterium]